MSTVQHARLLQTRRQCSATKCGHHGGVLSFVCHQLCKLAYAGEVVRRLNGLMVDESEVVLMYRFLKSPSLDVWNRSTEVMIKDGLLVVITFLTASI